MTSSAFFSPIAFDSVDRGEYGKMIQVDRSLFSNAMAAVSRTGNLPGGGVHGLPNGVVLRGLQGVGSVGSDVQDAQKEFEKGRIQTSLERIRQIESLFQGIAGRWNATASTIINGARSGAQQVSLHKLNEVKTAQSKMQQLIRPASKALQDLIGALELALTNDGRSEIVPEQQSAASPQQPETAPTAEAEPIVEAQAETETETEVDDSDQESDELDSNLLGQFATNYVFGNRLKLKKDANNKVHVDPALQENRFYFFHGAEPPRVFRIREIRRKEIVVFDPHFAAESIITAGEMKSMLQAGIWCLEAKKTTH